MISDTGEFVQGKQVFERENLPFSSGEAAQHKNKQ